MDVLARKWAMSNRDIPNYRTLTHRWTFFAFLFLLVSTLLGLLEYVFRTIPVATEGRDMPAGLYPILPGIKAEYQHAATAGDPAPEPTPTPTQRVKRQIEELAITTSFDPRDPRPPEPSFNNLGVITTRFTWADYWDDDPSRPGQNRVPASVSPLRDSNGPCVHFYRGMATSNDAGACEGVIRFTPLGDPGSEDTGLGALKLLDRSCILKYDAWLSDWSSCDVGAWCSADLNSDRKALMPFCLTRNISRDDAKETARRLREDGTIKPLGTLGDIGKGETDWAVVFHNHANLMLLYQAALTNVMVVGQAWRYSDRITSYNMVMEAFTPVTFSEEPVSETEDECATRLCMDTRPFTPPNPVKTTTTVPGTTQTTASAAITTQATTKATITTSSASSTSTTPATTQTTSLDTTNVSTQTSRPFTYSPEPEVYTSNTIIDVNIETTIYFATPHTTTSTHITTASRNGKVSTGTYTFTLTDPSTYSTSTRTLSGALVSVIPAVFTRVREIPITDLLGSTISTSTFFGANPILTPTRTTLYGPAGIPTAVIITSVPITTKFITFYNPTNGEPTATATEVPSFPSIPPSARNIHVAGHTEYFIVFFLPVVLSVLLAIPIQMLDAETKLHLPFRALTVPGGSLAKDSLCLRTGGIWAKWDGIRLLLRHHDPASVLSDLLFVCSTVLISLSSETIGIKARGPCANGGSEQCLLTLVVFEEPARAAEGLLGLVMALLVVLGVVIHGKKSGVAVHPGDFGVVCALMQNGQTKRVMRGVELGDGPVGDEELRTQLGDKNFVLGWDEKAGRGDEYGILVAGGDERTRRDNASVSEVGSMVGLVRRHAMVQVKSWSAWWDGLPEFGRALRNFFLFIHCALLAVILYYEIKVFRNPSESAFEAFMDSQQFGPRLLFTALASAVGLFWETMLEDVIMLSLFRGMVDSPQPADASVLRPQATNVFEALWHAVRLRKIRVGSVGLAVIFTHVLPVTMANIPFHNAQTWMLHEVCIWTSVAVLGYATLVLAFHVFWTSWIHLPVDPGTLAGRMYYVCDSAMLADFEHLSMLGRRQRDERVIRMNRLYKFGPMEGVVTGRVRLGADYGQGERGIKLKKLDGFGRGART
ncbi:hypothetical protein OQA88_11826 [Cercophora sp. LCS_1]